MLLYYYTSGYETSKNAIEEFLTMLGLSDPVSRSLAARPHRVNISGPASLVFEIFDNGTFLRTINDESQCEKSISGLVNLTGLNEFYSNVKSDMFGKYEIPVAVLFWTSFSMTLVFYTGMIIFLSASKLYRYVGKRIGKDSPVDGEKIMVRSIALIGVVFSFVGILIRTY